ncbi:hypothetical protein L5515_018562 [Caenorhabditis briggsae]|uniref:Uncharacterized protein n=1 Tax=Caenorhabditis briggsae TaxID=6238 RepID=A0AAE9FCN1_CAEBR|nr:hypothetical protein L5515_018562 [Caenorhabditis briggsae]
MAIVYIEGLPDPSPDTLAVYTKCREDLNQLYIEAFQRIPKPGEHFPWFTKYLATTVCENFIIWPETVKTKRPNDKSKCRSKIVETIKVMDIPAIHKELQHEVAKWMTHIKCSEIETASFNEELFDRYYERRFEDLMGWIDPILEFIQNYQSDFLYLSDHDVETIHGHIEQIKDQYNLGRLGLKQRGSSPREPESKVENPVVRELERELNHLRTRIMIGHTYIESLAQNPRESVAAQRENEAPLDKKIVDTLEQIVEIVDAWKKEFRDHESQKYIESADFFLQYVTAQFKVLLKKETELGFLRNDSFRKPEKMQKDHFFDTETSCVELSKINATLGTIFTRDAWITRELKKKALSKKTTVNAQVDKKLIKN